MKLDLSAPHQTYPLKDGTIAPGVTSILNVVDKSQSLLPWACGLERGMVGKVCADVYEAMISPPPADPEWIKVELPDQSVEARVGHFIMSSAFALPKQYAYQTAVKGAQDVGTITHARIEAWRKHGSDVLSPEGLPPDLYAQSQAGFDRFVAWYTEEGRKPLATELQLVSERYRYGGTLDCVDTMPDGTLSLLDIKTSKANRRWPYPTVIGQLSAYRVLWDEHAAEGGLLPISSVHVFRVGKDKEDAGQVVHVTDARLGAGWRLFEGARTVYFALKSLEKWQS